MKWIFICLLTAMVNAVAGQSAATAFSPAGKYTGEFNGDHITLELTPVTSNTFTGYMKDSQQTFSVELSSSGHEVSGVAVEPSLGLAFQISGTCDQNTCNLRFAFELLGEVSTMEVLFRKNGAEHSPRTAAANESNSSGAVFPSGAQHPANVAGTWMQEQMYQSGAGDQYMGAGFSSTMTFLPNGTMMDGGSATYISGSNYSGNSSGAGSGILPNIWWYTIDNQFYILVLDQGKYQSAHLGKYYIENNHMLITNPNGEKLLLSRK